MPPIESTSPSMFGESRTFPRRWGLGTNALVQPGDQTWIKNLVFDYSILVFGANFGHKYWRLEMEQDPSLTMMSLWH